MPAVVRKHRDTVLVIVGSEPENALNRTDSVLEDIKSAIEEHDLAEHVLMTGRIDDNSLQAAYGEADCFIFPLREVPHLQKAVSAMPLPKENRVFWLHRVTMRALAEHLLNIWMIPM